MRAYGERHGDAWLEGDLVRWTRGDRRPPVAVRRVLKRRARRDGSAETVLPIETEPWDACDGFGHCCMCCEGERDEHLAWIGTLSPSARSVSPSAECLVAQALARAGEPRWP